MGDKQKYPVYEHKMGQPLKEDQYDGMEDMLGDDVLPTDWDPETEDPPHDEWLKTIKNKEE